MWPLECLSPSLGAYSIVAALIASHTGALDRLAIYHAGARLRVPLQADPYTLAQSGVHPFPGAVEPPRSEVMVDGLITNDKFCFTRRSRLKLRPKRRGYPSRKGVRRGGIDETQLDRSTHEGRPRRRRSSLGPGLCAPPPLGATQGNHERGGA